MKHPFSRVYIGIVTYNSADIVGRCIDAALRQSYKPITIIVLDNFSHDGIDRVATRYSNKVVFIKNVKNIGFGGGHNKIIQSIQMRNTDYYLALNPDAVLDPDCVKDLLRGVKKHNADWGTGKLYKNIKTRILYSVGHAMRRDGYAFNIGYGIYDHGQYDMEKEVFGAAGAAALYKGKMIRDVSITGDFFDPALFMYNEDVDVDWRARLFGFRCWYVPEAIVHHAGGLFPSHLEAEVLVNRFLSVIKNAFYVDLLMYNVPMITAHVVGRLILTPVVGVQIVFGLIKGVPHALLHRSKARVSRTLLNGWFAQASQEVSQVPTSLWLRVVAFAHRKIYGHV